MGILDNALKNATKSVYGAFGKPMALRRQVGGGYDPSTGGQSDPTFANYRVNGRVEDYADALVDGALVQAGDRKVTFAAADLPRGLRPEVTDKWLVGNIAYSIVRVKGTDATEEVALWEVQVRR